eukprot:6175112-Pleurochrysis_carterae.AAC.1
MLARCCGGNAPLQLLITSACVELGAQVTLVFFDDYVRAPLHAAARPDATSSANAVPPSAFAATMGGSYSNDSAYSNIVPQHYIGRLILVEPTVGALGPCLGVRCCCVPIQQFVKRTKQRSDEMMKFNLYRPSLLAPRNQTTFKGSNLAFERIVAPDLGAD